jgi:hypothetical protein
MARYESYGAQDTRYEDDLDSNFIGINNRARPDSLASGVLQKAENFRLDIGGVAQIRKAIQVQSAPLTLDQ